MLCDNKLLKRLLRWADFDCLSANLSTNTLPERFIAVQHNHLVRNAVHGPNLAGNETASRGEEGLLIRNVAEPVTVRIVIISDRIGSSQVRWRREKYVLDSIQLRTQEALHLSEEPDEISVGYRVVGSRTEESQGRCRGPCRCRLQGTHQIPAVTLDPFAGTNEVICLSIVN